MRLHEQVKLQSEIIQQYKEDIADLRRHLNSSKFHQDTTIQVNDVLLKLNELDNEVFFKEVRFN